MSKFLMSGLLVMASLAALAAPVAAKDAALMQQAKAMFKPLPSEPPALPDNPYSEAKAELGRHLYFDPRLSRSWLISCNTCHNMGLGGVDLMETSIGHGWSKGPRNAPTVLNSVYHVAQFWDGRAKDLKAQAMGPMQAGVEMNNTPERVEQTLRSIPSYAEMFEAAFPESEQAVSFENTAAAIEVFEATLITPDAPFDQYLRGDAAALTDQAKQGLKHFMDFGCTSCHGGMNLGGHAYFKFGLVNAPATEVRPAEDVGRQSVTGSAADQFVFRVPTLRNVALTAPYFHSGKVWELAEAVKIMAWTQLGRKLEDEQAAAIVAFLASLTGEQPEVVQPILPPHTAETPLPDTSVAASEAPAGH